MQYIWISLALLNSAPLAIVLQNDLLPCVRKLYAGSAAKLALWLMLNVTPVADLLNRALWPWWHGAQCLRTETSGGIVI